MVIWWSGSVPSYQKETPDYEIFSIVQLEDGDIICYQRALTREEEEAYRYPDVPSFLEYVRNRQVRLTLRRLWITWSMVFNFCYLAAFLRNYTDLNTAEWILTYTCDGYFERMSFMLFRVFCSLFLVVLVNTFLHWVLGWELWRLYTFGGWRNPRMTSFVWNCKCPD